MRLLSQLKHIVILGSILLICGCAEINESTDDSTANLTYVEDIEPIFRQSCIRCHGIDEIRAGLYLTEYDSIVVASDKILLQTKNTGYENMYQYLNSPIEAKNIRNWIEIDDMDFD